MSSKQYWKNQLGMLALALFLIANDNGIQAVLFIFAAWLIILVSCLLLFYYFRKKYLDKLLDMTEKLDERYLLPEIMQEPERADEQVFYQIMKMSEKSMLEHIPAKSPSFRPEPSSFTANAEKGSPVLWVSVFLASRRPDAV